VSASNFPHLPPHSPHDEHNLHHGKGEAIVHLRTKSSERRLAYATPVGWFGGCKTAEAASLQDATLALNITKLSKSGFAPGFREVLGVTSRPHTADSSGSLPQRLNPASSWETQSLSAIPKPVKGRFGHFRQTFLPLPGPSTSGVLYFNSPLSDRILSGL
jgi:hypothetical protein